MATRDAQAAEIERLRVAQGEQFLKQMGEMFSQTRLDIDAKFIPRTVLEERFAHVDDSIDRMAAAVEKLTGNVASFHENAPRIYADRAETKADMAELKTEIEKLKTARETDKERGYGWRYEDATRQYGARYDDQAQRYRGEAMLERGWRGQAQAQGTQLNGWLIGGGLSLGVLAVSIIVQLAMR